MEILFVDREIEYTGRELRHHWIYENFGIVGDALVSFIGKAHVDISSMVDLEDVKKKEPIYSPKMLHFIMELFGDVSLEKIVLWQRLFIVTLKEQLEDMAVAGRIVRDGDDLYHIGIADVRRKLSVSIATISLVSSLMHTGLNIHTEGTPVPCVGLYELGVEPKVFAERVMNKFNKEVQSIYKARCKVRGV